MSKDARMVTRMRTEVVVLTDWRGLGVKMEKRRRWASASAGEREELKTRKNKDKMGSVGR
jgi:hypothetical protein